MRRFLVWALVLGGAGYSGFRYVYRENPSFRAWVNETFHVAWDAEREAAELEEFADEAFKSDEEIAAAAKARRIEKLRRQRGLEKDGRRSQRVHESGSWD